MKKYLHLFLIACFSIKSQAQVISTNMINGDFIVIPNGYSNFYERKGITNKITLTSGKQLVVHGINISPFMSVFVAKAFVRANNGTNEKVELASLSSGGGASSWVGPILGPIEIEYGMDQTATYWGTTNGFSLSSAEFLMEIKSSQFETNEVASLVIPSTSVVVPSNVVGDVDVLLEQSNDMITWTQCLPGTYNASTQKRFFRVRAVEK
jgi:hypothetical protein